VDLLWESYQQAKIQSPEADAGEARAIARQDDAKMRTRMKILHILALGLFVAGSSLVGGCGFTQGKKDAEAVLARHFRAIATNGVDTAMADYDPQFFQKTTKDDWMKALTNLNSKLGRYQNHTITGWRVFKNAGTSGTGTTVSLECQVTYSKHRAKESFTLFKGMGDPDYKIIGHNITSTALLTE